MIPRQWVFRVTVLADRGERGERALGGGTQEQILEDARVVEADLGCCTLCGKGDAGLGGGPLATVGAVEGDAAEAQRWKRGGGFGGRESDEEIEGLMGEGIGDGPLGVAAAGVEGCRDAQDAACFAGIGFASAGRGLLDLDVPMLHDHKRYELRVGAAVSGAGIGDEVPGVIEVGGLGSAGFVSPAAVEPLAVPVEVVEAGAGRDHEGDEVAAGPGALVVGVGGIDQVVVDGAVFHAGPIDRKAVHGAGCSSGLGKRVGAVVATVVVAVVPTLSLAAIVPPRRLIDGCTGTNGALGEADGPAPPLDELEPVAEEFADLLGRESAHLELAEQSGASEKLLLESGLGDEMGEAGAVDAVRGGGRPWEDRRQDGRTAQ